MLHLETVSPDTLALLRRIQSLPVLAETRLGRLAHMDDIAAMKLETIVNRGSKKDFMDVAVLLERYSLRQMLDLYRKKYPNGVMLHVMRSLVYFEDAESTDMPMMLMPCTWEAAKDRICDAVRVIARKSE